MSEIEILLNGDETDAKNIKNISDQIELESFETVVLCFDNDKAGQAAARKVARILKPNKSRIMSFPNGYKDANDMLKQKDFKGFTQAWWEAKSYTPSGIMELSSQKQDWLVREEKQSIAYPWEGLNRKLYGLRQGELLTLTGGTGLGKSSVTRELEHWLIKQTKDNVGIIALEENWLRTADGLISIEANDRLYLNEKRKVFADERKKLYKKIGYKDVESLLKDWENDHAKNWDANDLLLKLKTWQLNDISKGPIYKSNYIKALKSIRAKTILMPCNPVSYTHLTLPTKA